MVMKAAKRIRHRPRGSLVGVLDIGTTKVACFIARVEDGDELRIVGVGHQSSLGLKSGTIVDMHACTNAIGQAVNAAEQMCGETIQEVLVNLAATHIESHGVTIEVTIAGHQVGDLDLRRALVELAPGQRRAVVLRHLWGLSVEETAAELGVAPGTVKSQTADAVRRLRELLAPQHEEGPAR